MTLGHIIPAKAGIHHYRAAHGFSLRWNDINIVSCLKISYLIIMLHLLSITDFIATIERLLDRAELLLHTVVKHHGQLPLLTGQVVANLF